MQVMFHDTPPQTTSSSWAALFALGFRPFFLLAGIFAVLLMSDWVVVLHTGGSPSGYYGLAVWHAHEMLFGYSVAVVAGFLLTAVRNWTGVNTPQGGPLALLAGIWLLGRLLPFTAAPQGLVAAADLIFLPWLALAVAIPLYKTRQRHNYMFLLVLATLAVANALVHLELLGLVRGYAALGIKLGLYMIVMLMVLMGGRVFPFFTERGLGGTVTVKKWKSVEIMAVVSLVALAAAEVLVSNPVLTGVAATVCAAVHAVRLGGWYSAGIWRVPLLWVLHLGYIWMIAGFALTAAAAAGWIPPPLAVHAFTVGGIGGITLGMMARVSLGHTGRQLEGKRALTIAFIAINLAVLVRVLAPMLMPGAHARFMVLSGTLWAAAFIIFVWIYAPILVKPRVDGRPG